MEFKSNEKDSEKTEESMENNLIEITSDNNRLISRLAAISTIKRIDKLSNKFEIYEIYKIDLKCLKIFSNDTKKQVRLLLRRRLTLRFVKAYFHQSYEPANEKKKVDSSSPQHILYQLLRSQNATGN